LKRNHDEFLARPLRWNNDENAQRERQQQENQEAKMLDIFKSTKIQCTITQMLLFIMSFSNLSYAKGKINGIVTDRETGSPLPGANVRIVGTPWGAATASDGRFVIPNVPDGTYNVEASMMGYEPQRIENQFVEENLAIELKFVLTEKPVQLQDVVVTPGHFAIMRQQPAVQQTLTREDIRSIPQFGEDIYRAVQRLPGISGNDYSAKFTMRGGENDEVLVLLDGLELYEPFHLKDINGGGLSIIDVEAIGGIKMMTGGFPAEYGDRLSGVFNIDSAQPTPGRRKTALGISFMNARLMSEGTFNNDRGQWLVSARRGYLDLISGLVDPQSTFRPTYYDVLSKVQYQLTGNHTLSLNFLHAGDDLNIEDDDDGDVAATSYGNSYGWLTLKSVLSPKFYAQTVLSAGRVGQNREGTDFDGSSGEVRAFVTDKRHFNVFALKQDWSFHLTGRHLLKWGFDAKRLTSSYDYFNRDRFITHLDANSILFDYDTTAINLTPDGNEFGVYLTDRMRLSEPLTAEFGLRYDRNSYTNDDKLSPRLNLAYTFGRRSVLRLGWGRFYQSQGINEIDVQDGDDTFYPTELAEHRVIGVEHGFANGINFRVEAYQKRLSDLRPRYHNLSGSLEFFPEVEDDRIRLEPENGEAKGIEVFVKKDAGGKFSWWGSYAYATAEDKIDGRNVPRNFDQRQTIYLDLNYRPSPKWRINMAWQYHTGWPVTEAGFEKVVLADGAFYYRKIYGPINAGRYPAFHRMDLRVNRYISTSTGRVSLFLEIVNLYNRFNVRNYYYNDVRLPSGGFTFVRKAERWFPRLPSLGVSWEF
jgi:outer membrane receptor for ferrienterochelin and colicin